MTGFPEVAVAERAMLEQFLDFHRAGVVRTLDGMTDAEAAERVLPATDLTVGGIVGRLESLDVQAARASFGDKLVSLRWIYLHMIEETAQHRGHLDLLLDAIRQK